jgi:RNA polymerase sigma-70 factor (ECF subfamily)
MTDSAESLLLDRAISGDLDAMGQLLQQHRDRLLRLVGFRMDRRLQGRVDPADVLQETFIEATRRRDELPRQPDSLFVWLRFLAMQKLLEIHRRHLDVQSRDVSREVSIYDAPAPHVTSAVLAAQLLGKLTSPSQAAQRAEMKYRLEQLLKAMNALDQEIIALRHFEQLSNSEAAQVLGINESAASTRYVRAIRRLRDALQGNTNQACLATPTASRLRPGAK